VVFNTLYFALCLIAANYLIAILAVLAILTVLVINTLAITLSNMSKCHTNISATVTASGMF